jgi:hypothetical protein
MSGLTGKAALGAEGLRERNVSLRANDEDEARMAVLHLNALEEKAEKSDKDKKTFGRTPDGIGKDVGIAQQRKPCSRSPRFSHTGFIWKS